jgi:hypothetical protein
VSAPIKYSFISFSPRLHVDSCTSDDKGKPFQAARVNLSLYCMDARATRTVRRTGALPASKTRALRLEKQHEGTVLPGPIASLVSQQAPIVTREQSVPQPHIGGVTRGAFTAASAALRLLDSARGKDRHRRHASDRQCEQ